MENKNTFSKTLAIAGTVLVWFPLLAPVLLSVISLITDSLFRFDYLMPAELFLFALAGSALLLWTAFRIHLHQKLIGWGLGLAIAFLFGSQAVAVATGLAHGETEIGGWQFYLVIVILIAYILALIAIGIGGIRLLRDLFKKAPAPSLE